MKSLLVAILMALLPLAVTAQTQHLKFIQDGAFASLNQTTGPNSSFSLQVSVNAATGTQTSASLSYLEFDFAPDFSSLTFIQIQGAIPSADFTGQNTQNLALNFSTNDLDPTTSISQMCTFDFTTLITTCSPIAGGTIQVQWRENDVQRSQVALIREDTLGSVTTRVHQHSDNASASAQGTVLGVVVSPTAAQVGINHSSTMELIKN